ncbi:MAG: serine/threonine-protein kinase [Bacillota bacterium]|nr:serine/threonine-protein kinase [Bacillota bacterium]
MKQDFEKSIEFDLFQCDYGKSLVERYQMLDLLYESERSAVYKMIRYADQKIFTLKALKNEQGIVYDISRIAHLSHEGMAKIVEFGESEHYKYVVKPYVEGLTLLEYVEIKGALNEKEVKNIARQIIDVFEYFHSQSEPIIYRDLKPANIIMGSDGKIVLIDVETMRIVGRNRGSDTFYVGTHGYASPEQYGFRQSDIRSDIYSLGATLYFLLTGSEPVVESVKYRQITEINPKISSQMAYVISKCMQFNPEERFKNVLGIKRALTSRVSLGNFRNRKIKLGLTMLAVILLLIISGNYLVQAITANIMSALTAEQEKLIALEPRPEPEIESELISDSEQEQVQEPEPEPEPTPVSEPKPVVKAPVEQTAINEVEQTAIKQVEQTPENPVVEPEPEPEPEAEPIPVTEPESETAVASRGYDSENEVDLSQISELSNGISIHLDGEHPNYNIKVDRSLLPSGVNDFKFISVFSFGGIISDKDIRYMIFSGEEYGHGLQYYYDDLGFFSYFSGDGYLVILYDADYFCVGYQYFERSEFVVN